MKMDKNGKKKIMQYLYSKIFKRGEETKQQSSTEHW